MLEWVPVHGSSRIVAEAYDPSAETIFVRFEDGTEWYYRNCPASVWTEFTAEGQSRGSYIHRELNLKPNGRHAG